MSSVSFLQSTKSPGTNVIRLIHPSITASTAKGGDPVGILTLPLPEDISFGVSSSWEAFSEGSLIDFVNKGAKYLGDFGEAGAFSYETYARATNKNAFISSFSHQTWRSTSPLEFQLKVTLSAFESAKGDVMEKLERLVKLSLPGDSRSTSNDGLIGKIEGLAIGAVKQADPNATLITPPPRDIGLYLGTNIRIPAIVIPNVNISFETRADSMGNFIFATADISIKSSYTPSASLFKFEGFKSPDEINSELQNIKNAQQQFGI